MSRRVSPQSAGGKATYPTPIGAAPREPDEPGRSDHALMALLGVCLQLGLQGRKFGERGVGVRLLLAFAALRRLAAILVVVAVLLVMTMILAMVSRKGRR